MDRLVQRASIAMARTSSRRDFLSGMARLFVGAGFGASFLFGGRRHAFADKNCTGIFGAGTPGHKACDATVDCRDGDHNGCNILDYCKPGKGGKCPKPEEPGRCPPGRTATGEWVCCCHKKLSFCTDCELPGGPNPGPNGLDVCICHRKGGDCTAT
jgi:hypothetical protein